MKATKKENIAARSRLVNPPSLDARRIAFSAQERVDRAARVINGYVVIQRGEALGWDQWVDGTFLEQVVAAGNAASHGVKVRWTHPDLCSDGLGKFLGRARGFRRDGQLVRADLHISDTTESAPEFERDPGEYVMRLAEEDPAAFATSIVFSHDIGAESRFFSDHQTRSGAFKSPDADNPRNLPHIRLAKLWANDLVDQAAAAASFFSEHDELTARASAALEYVLADGPEPEPGTFGAQRPERVKSFVRTWLSRHGLAVKSPQAQGQTRSTADLNRAFASAIAEHQKAHGAPGKPVSFAAAASAVARLHPDLYPRPTTAPSPRGDDA